MIKAVLFDFFGVLFPDTFWGLANKYLEKRDAEVQAKLHALIKQSDLGMISKKDFWQYAAELFGISLEELEKELANYGGTDKVLLSRIRSLKEQGIKTGIISNVGVGMFESSLGEDKQLFDVLILSGDTGFVKPDPQVYELAIKRLGLAASECLFFDDIPRNVRGAEAVGMKAVLYRGIHDYDAAVASLVPNMND